MKAFFFTHDLPFFSSVCVKKKVIFLHAEIIGNGDRFQIWQSFLMEMPNEKGAPQRVFFSRSFSFALALAKYELLNSLIVINQQWIHQCSSHVIRGRFLFFVGRIKISRKVWKNDSVWPTHTHEVRKKNSVKLDLNRKWIMTFESNVLSLAHEFHSFDIISTSNNYSVCFCFRFWKHSFYFRTFCFSFHVFSTDCIRFFFLIHSNRLNLTNTSLSCWSRLWFHNSRKKKKQFQRLIIWLVLSILTSMLIAVATFQFFFPFRLLIIIKAFVWI